MAKCNYHFPTNIKNCYKTVGFTILRNDTWLILGKSYSTWQWIMQLKPQAMQ
jgi:hypothetical protein